MTYSPTSFDAVPLAQRHLTAEFGMGSGVLLALGPPDRERSNQRCAYCAELSKDALEEVFLLPDQIKPIEPLVPVS